MGATESELLGCWTPDPAWFLICSLDGERPERSAEVHEAFLIGAYIEGEHVTVCFLGCFVGGCFCPKELAPPWFLLADNLI